MTEKPRRYFQVFQVRAVHKPHLLFMLSCISVAVPCFMLVLAATFLML